MPRHDFSSCCNDAFFLPLLPLSIVRTTLVFPHLTISRKKFEVSGLTQFSPPLPPPPLPEKRRGKCGKREWARQDFSNRYFLGPPSPSSKRPTLPGENGKNRGNASNFILSETRIGETFNIFFSSSTHTPPSPFFSGRARFNCPRIQIFVLEMWENNSMLPSWKATKKSN